MRRTFVLTVLALLALPAAPAPAAVLPLVPGTPCQSGEQGGDISRRSDPANVPLDGTVMVSPDRIETEGPLAAGTVMTCSITVRSRHSEAATFELTPYGLLGGSDASLRYLSASDAGVDATALDWIELAETSITIPPRGVVTVPVIVRVPDDPPAGAAYASINIVSSSAADTGDTSVGIESQVAMQLLLQTTGEGRPGYELHDVDAPLLRWDRAAWTLTASVENVGTMHGTPRGAVHVRSMFGSEVARVSVVGRPLLPGGATPIRATWNKVPWFGLYRTELRLESGADGRSVAVPVRGWLIALPPWWGVSLVAAVLAAWLLARLIRRRRERMLDAFDDDADDDDFDSASD